MKTKIWGFEVQGSGDFPFDMLRYDQCWPAREAEDSYKLDPDRVDPFETRAIRLRGLQRPTEGRWASFGWRVIYRILLVD